MTPTASPTPVRSSGVIRELAGFTMPIRGLCLPDSDVLMPNALRTYRNGVHEGVDFYEGSSCAPVSRSTEVLAARDGIVIRADIAYQPLTRAEAARQESTPENLDRFRGRQVWVDHGTEEGTGRRIVTRYAHLDRVAPGIGVGIAVRAGQGIAYVGNSGTPESLDNPEAELHLHFELRVGDTFLGQGQPPAEVRRLYGKLFG